MATQMTSRLRCAGTSWITKGKNKYLVDIAHCLIVFRYLKAARIFPVSANDSLAIGFAAANLNVAVVV